MTEKKKRDLTSAAITVAVQDSRLHGIERASEITGASFTEIRRRMAERYTAHLASLDYTALDAATDIAKERAAAATKLVSQLANNDHQRPDEDGAL